MWLLTATYCTVVPISLQLTQRLLKNLLSLLLFRFPLRSHLLDRLRRR
jgi:hypothetical protein